MDSSARDHAPNADAATPEEALPLGRFERELRAMLERKAAEGVRYGSGGTWAPGSESLTREERARAVLAFQWEIDNGGSFRVNCIEPPWGRRYSLPSMKARFVVHWRRVPGWLSDQLRRPFWSLRLWWRRKVLRIANPYTSPVTAPLEGVR